MINSLARGNATDLGCAATNALSASIRFSGDNVRVNSTCSFSSSGFAGPVVVVLRSVRGDRVGRDELLAVVSLVILGEACAPGLSDRLGVGDEIGDGEACGDSGEEGVGVILAI